LIIEVEVPLQTSIYQLPPVCIAETLALTRGIVDLWYYFHESFEDADLISAQEAIMTADERERCGKFHFERDRRLFRATRALVRSVLSRYSGIAPHDWRFAANAHGKPHVSSPVVLPSLHFNLANTRGLVVCAVSAAHKILGVDAERIDRGTETMELAERYFCASEVRALKASPASERLRSFFTYWTLKESYIKARGLGLTLPLDWFSFIVDDDSISIGFDARLGDNATRWRFALLDAHPNYMIALGVDTDGTALSLRASHIVPLRERADERPRQRDIFTTQ
jgi:4'-phosphopantetheinyl transferase